MELTPADLSAVQSAIHDVHTKWHDIGLELKVPVPILDSIESKHVDDNICLREVVAEWLKGGDHPTWQSLVDALKAKVIDEQKLAAELEAKYCSEIPGDYGTNFITYRCILISLKMI